MPYIYTEITYPPFDIGSGSISAGSGDGFQSAEPIPYTEDELECLDTEKEHGVLYVCVRAM